MDRSFRYPSGGFEKKPAQTIRLLEPKEVDAFKNCGQVSGSAGNRWCLPLDSKPYDQVVGKICMSKNIVHPTWYRAAIDSWICFYEFSWRNLFWKKYGIYVNKNKCGMYGSSWACPPAVGSVEECVAECLTYTQAFMFYKSNKKSIIVYNVKEWIQAAIETRKSWLTR